MTTKWEFLDHPDGTEAPYAYDDQTPPCYVERTSTGVWSFTKTGTLANREDYNPGNNWDYITDNGTTVSFYWKDWDAGGYWRGPYLKATWPSNTTDVVISASDGNLTAVTSDGNFYLKQPSSSTGPSVSSITVANEIASTRNFTVTHTGTLSASDITYFIDGVDITTLTNPNTPITNLQTTSTGSTFDSYTVNKYGQHTIKIDDTFLQFHVASSVSSYSDQRLIDNNISVTWPATTTAWLNHVYNMYQSATITNNRVRMHAALTGGSGKRVDEWLEIDMRYVHYLANGTAGYKYVITQHYYYPTAYATSQFGYWDPVTNLSKTITANPQSELLFNNELTFDFATQNSPPTTNGTTATSSRGSNYDDRFPLITTNLFNRQRSVYAIGMTHKDTWDLFL
jgi:hypothetical protein